MATRHRSFRTGGPRRKTQWIGPPLQGYITVASGGATLISSLVLEEPTTAVRVRGMVSIQPQLTNADIELIGAVGIGVVSAEALAVGITALPEPYSDADWGGWMVWRSFAYQFRFEDATATQYPRWDFEVDSKAMRKVGPSDALVFVAESFAGAFKVADTTRQLLKLS